LRSHRLSGILIEPETASIKRATSSLAIFMNRLLAATEIFMELAVKKSKGWVVRFQNEIFQAPFSHRVLVGAIWLCQVNLSSPKVGGLRINGAANASRLL
jgi:hypothetical protein